MLEKTDEIFTGLKILNKILEPENIFIGIEANKPDAIEIMEKYAAESEINIEIVPLKLKYPQGDEKQLLKAVLDKEVPSGKLPLHIGAVVSNVGTVYSIYEAVTLNKPINRTGCYCLRKGDKKSCKPQGKSGNKSRRHYRGLRRTYR